MSDLDRAIAHAAATLGLSHDVALLLPVRVVADLWREKLRRERSEEGDEDEPPSPLPE